ncbi:NUP43 [Auxenochlorella protothecoides x Auxenochlorella symbiontica]
MPEPRLSRHFLGESCTSAALIPVPQYPHTSLLAVGSWSTDAQEHRVSLVSLHGGHQAGPSLSSLASLTVDGKVVGLRVYGTDASQRHVVALTRAGSLCCLRLSLPEGGAESLHGMQASGEGVPAGRLGPLHTARGAQPTGLALLGAGAQAVCVDWQGGARLVDLGAAPRRHPGTQLLASASDPEPSRRFTCADAPPSGSTFLTGDAAGGVAVWDARAAPGACPAQELGPPSPAPAVQGVWVHPTQPHLVAAGDAGGALALWDLRAMGGPAWRCPGRAGCGAVVGAAFAPSAAPRVAFATLDGTVALASAAGRSAELYREPCAGMAALVGDGDALLALTAQEGLLVMQGVLG